MLPQKRAIYLAKRKMDPADLIFLKIIEAIHSTIAFRGDLLKHGQGKRFVLKSAIVLLIRQSF